MTVQPQKRLTLHWTAPKNLLAILLFILVTIILQYFIVALTMSAGTSDPTAITIPAINSSISLLYHVLPAAVTITLTASFIHLTSQATTLSTRSQTLKRPPTSQAHPKPTRLKALRQFTRNLQRSARRIKQRILQASGIANLQRRMAPAKAIIRSALIVAATFTIIIVLVAIAAYPHIVPATTVGLHTWNTAFHGFVMATIHVSQSIANSIPPIGAVATAINNALLAASPAFRNTLEGAASSMTAGFVTFSPVEKYLVIQNAAVWTTAIVTLSYRWFAKTPRRRW